MKSLKAIIAITILIISFFGQTTFAQTNLTGTWLRNNEKCDGGGLSINSIALKLEVIQDNSAVTIKGTNKNGKGDIITYTDVLKPDENETERAAGTDQKKTITATWSTEKGVLTESATYTNKEGKVTQTIKAIFSLSPDGKTLMVKDERTYDGETHALTEVYNKQ